MTARRVVLVVDDLVTDEDLEALRRDPVIFAGWVEDPRTGHEDYPRVLPAERVEDYPDEARRELGELLVDLDASDGTAGLAHRLRGILTRWDSP